MDKKKELIDEMIDKLKSAEDFAYQEGAWENFKNNYQTVNKHTAIIDWRKWSAAAAVLLAFGASIFWYNKDYSFIKDEVLAPNNIISNNDNLTLNNSTESLENLISNKERNSSSTAESEELDYVLNENTLGLSSRVAYLGIPGNIESSSSIKLLEPQEIDAFSSLNTLKIINIQNATAQPKNVKLAIPSNTILASSTLPYANLKIKEVELANNRKEFKISDRFDLGLFVSPHSTSNDKMKVGGGMLISYNLNKNLSIRTGASYNTYEVGALKDPIESTNAELVNIETAMNVVAGDKNASNYQSKMMLPNINAVTGFVQSVEIPLEMKYTFGKSFYTAAGVSYSAIVGQRREAHYIENVNIETFKGNFPNNEHEVAQAVQVVTKTATSAEKNVNNNSFNGFANFSIGKKVSLKNKFGLSIEPFVKIPLGSYRRADMDYTNGGIRIMTNF